MDNESRIVLKSYFPYLIVLKFSIIEEISATMPVIDAASRC